MVRALAIKRGRYFGGRALFWRKIVKSMLNLEGAPPWAHVFSKGSSKPLILRKILVKDLDLRMEMALTWINNLSH